MSAIFHSKDFSKYFGLALHAKRKELGINQSVLANRVGVSLTAVSLYERGKSIPRIHVAARLAKALETSLNDLISNTLHFYNGQRIPK